MPWQDGPYEGHWMVRCCRDCPMVPARLWFCDHEPGDESNKVDQPYLQGQLGLELHEPNKIWEMLEFCESSPEDQRLLADPPLSDRMPRGQRARAFQYAPMSKWKQDRARRISESDWQFEVADLAWAKEHAPDEPKVSPLTKVSLQQLPIPF